MKIKRNVNGQEMEFELTGEEMYKAFYEQQNQFYKDDILFVLKEEFYTDVDDEQIAQMIEIYDDYLSEDENWRSYVEKAILEVLDETK